VENETELFRLEFGAKESERKVAAIELSDEPTARELTVRMEKVALETERGQVVIGGSAEGVGTTDLRPRLSLDLRQGMRIQGAVGSRYRIEYVEELGVSGGWKELRMVELKDEAATVPLSELVGPKNRFYRAMWAP
jgi:hypothetical protein